MQCDGFRRMREHGDGPRTDRRARGQALEQALKHGDRPRSSTGTGPAQTGRLLAFCHTRAQGQAPTRTRGQALNGSLGSSGTGPVQDWPRAGLGPAQDRSLGTDRSMGTDPVRTDGDRPRSYRQIASISQPPSRGLGTGPVLERSIRAILSIGGYVAASHR